MLKVGDRVYILNLGSTRFPPTGTVVTIDIISHSSFYIKKFKVYTGIYFNKIPDRCSVCSFVHLNSKAMEILYGL